MRKSPKRINSTSNGNRRKGPPKRLRLDSPHIRNKIAAADIVRADDPDLGGGTIFYGRELAEEVIRSGVPRSANVLRVALDLVSDEPERLDTLIRELKGSSSFRPADLFPEVDIDATSFSSASDLLHPVRVAVNELRAQHRALFPLMQRRFYYYVRARGFMAAHEALHCLPSRNVCRFSGLIP